MIDLILSAFILGLILIAIHFALKADTNAKKYNELLAEYRSLKQERENEVNTLITQLITSINLVDVVQQRYKNGN